MRSRPRRSRLLLALAIVALAVLSVAAVPAVAGATERVRITWDTETDIDLHVFDEAGNHAYFAQPGAIPEGLVSSDNTVGFGPEFFTDDAGAGVARTFRLEACYYAGDSGATAVSGTITDGAGTARPVSVTLGAPGECAELGVSRGASDADGDGVLDGADACPSEPAPGAPDGCPARDADGDGVRDPADACPTQPAPGTTDGCPANRPPVARNDHWDVRAGGYVYDNALENDADPDGDRFTPRVLSISFRAAEWSGMEQDGTFNYVSGKGTRVEQRKVVTYVLVDVHGARSAPATMTIDVVPPGGKRGSPLRGRASASAAAAARWYGNPTSVTSCFGSGFDQFCFTVLGPRQVQVVNATTPWLSLPSPGEAAAACARRFSGGGIGRCAAGLLSGPLVRSGDKQILRVAANAGDCVMYRQDLNRTALHPVAGEWTKPSFSPSRSLVGLGKWGTWSKGLTGAWRVPVTCTTGGAWMLFPSSLVEL